MPSETSIYRAILQMMNQVYPSAKFIKTHSNAFTGPGTPDLIGCVCGRMIALEVKRPGEKATKIQEHELEQWQKAGAITGVVHSPKEAIDIVGKVLEW